MKKYKSSEVGFLGEFHVQYMLAKMKIKSMRLTPEFEYDILTTDDIRIEVKTGVLADSKKNVGDKIYITKRWQFLNHKHTAKWVDAKKIHIFKKWFRRCDFFVFVCMGRDYDVQRCYIVPAEIVGNKRMVVIGYRDKHLYKNYRDRWDLITNFGKKDKLRI